MSVRLSEKIRWIFILFTYTGRMFLNNKNSEKVDAE